MKLAESRRKAKDLIEKDKATKGKKNRDSIPPIIEESKPKKKYNLPKKNNNRHNLYQSGSREEKKNPLNLEDDKGPSTDLDIKKNNINKKEYCNVLSQERINFQFDEYGEYPDDDFQPSIFFYKYLAVKPDLEKENSDKGKPTPKLKLYIPDTIVLNDLDSNYWVYTDTNGNVCRIDESDGDVIEKFKPENGDPNELIGVSKMPIMKDGRIDENRVDLLNLDELEKCLFSKSGSQMAIQRFVKCRGPKAFICRSVWKKDKPSYIYILTNKANFHDDEKNQNLKFVVNPKNKNSYFPLYSTSGKHLEETKKYMDNIVKFIEGHTDIIFDELVGDFLKDEAGIWWFINLKAMKIKNYSKFKSETGPYVAPQLDFFLNRRGGSEDLHQGVTRRFDYQTKIRCKFCGVNYPKQKLKYKLTTKMILETDKMLSHVDFEKNKFNCIDRPDLKHNDYSQIYLPYRVCENCYLLFETLNDIKNYQIKIANIFCNPVNEVNFGFGFYNKPGQKSKKLELTNDELLRAEKDYKDKFESDDSSEYIPPQKEDENTGGQTTQSNKSAQNKPNNLYRILIMFNDLFWSEKIKIPDDELYLLYTFLGKNYKVKITKTEDYTKDLDYSIINFIKIYNIICTEPEGFINYVEKNRQMNIQIGRFEISDEETKKNDVKKLLKKEIIIEDPDIYDGKEKFVPFASVDLSLQGLKYGTNYRNNLNGLLFKKDEPHYVGKLRCLIRIHKVKEIKDLDKYKLHNHFNVLIPPVNFVVSEELPDYWIELVERQKIREAALNEIMRVLRERKVKCRIQDKKKEILQALESLISYYSSKSSE